MAYLIGDVKVFKATQKEYDGRIYFSCLGMDKNNEVFKFSASAEDKPVNGDIYQMELSSSDRDLKPYIRFKKVK